MTNKWDTHFLEMAKIVSTMSKDPSTKTGAVIVDQGNRVVSTGYNGFPESMKDYEPWYQNREEKYSRIVHCEMNAFIYAQRDVRGCTLYTWPFISCDRCVVHMIQAGIYRFVAPGATAAQEERWGKEFTKTRKYIRECGCELMEEVIP